MIKFIGDVHAKFEEYRKLISKPLVTTIQVGDLGVGFGSIPKLTKNDYFIRGNHDNPVLCQNHPQYLGDYGIWGDIGYISGAMSTDQAQRTPGLDWWAEEQLSYLNMEEAIITILHHKPKIMVTHDCPSLVKSPDGSLTKVGLDVIFERYQPQLWVFGHHHESIREEVYGTRFVGLAELEVYEIE